MSSSEAKKFGRQFGQSAVISSEGWHRLEDDATFPRSGAGLDQAAPDYYSEIDLPGSDGRSRKVRYQLKFPDEAFEPAARKASATVQSALDSGSAIDRPLGQGPPR